MRQMVKNCTQAVVKWAVFLKVLIINVIIIITTMFLFTLNSGNILTRPNCRMSLMRFAASVAQPSERMIVT
jgi:hypothetical protein